VLTLRATEFVRHQGRKSFDVVPEVRAIKYNHCHAILKNGGSDKRNSDSNGGKLHANWRNQGANGGNVMITRAMSERRRGKDLKSLAMRTLSPEMGMKTAKMGTQAHETTMLTEEMSPLDSEMAILP
jgi:hypothetical protein